MLVEGWMPNGLAMSRKGVGGEGSLTCVSEGPFRKRCHHSPALSPKSHRMWPCLSEGAGVNWPDGHQAGDTQGLRRSWGKGHGSQVASPATGGRAQVQLSTEGSDSSCTEDAAPVQQGTPGGYSAESPSPSPLCPAAPLALAGGLGEGQ